MAPRPRVRPGRWPRQRPLKRTTARRAPRCHPAAKARQRCIHHLGAAPPSRRAPRPIFGRLAVAAHPHAVLKPADEFLESPPALKARLANHLDNHLASHSQPPLHCVVQPRTARQRRIRVSPRATARASAPTLLSPSSCRVSASRWPAGSVLTPAYRHCFAHAARASTSSWLPALAPASQRPDPCPLPCSASPPAPLPCAPAAP